MSVVLGLVFFLSGASALLFETLWFFQSGLALGNSIWASSLVLASFMGGLALGNGLAGALGHRVRNPIALYAALEIAIGITGMGLVFGLPALTPALAPSFGPLVDQPWLLNSLRLGIAFALMLVPATAMGATLPLLVAALYARDRRFGAVLGQLYGWNTLGAVAGAVVGEALLIGWFGIRGAAMCAAGGNALAAALVLGLARPLGAIGVAPSQQPRALRLGSRARWLLLAAFGFGGLLLAMEVVWFRFLLLFVAGTNLAFALMLAVVLFGIGAGGFAASAWLGRDGSNWRAATPAALIAGSLAALLYAGFGFQLSASGSPQALTAGAILELALPLMLPVSFLSGVLFTALGEGLHREIGGETRSTGLLTLANTTGAALGSLVGGFVLLPQLGIENSIRLLAAGYGLFAAFAWLGGARLRHPAGRITGAVSALALVGVIGFFPSGLMDERFLGASLKRVVPPETVVTAREGLTETLVYTRGSRFGEPLHTRLVTNGHSMSATHLPSQRYMKLFVYLPVALHPEPRSALLISYGVGVTARALVDTREIETIDVVDISRDILDMSATIAGDGRRSLAPAPGDSPLEDPRVAVHIEDGRFFLQATDRRFDLITGEPPPPKLAGIVNLYTLEYFELVRDRLEEGGVATYWLPVHALMVSDALAILRAFCDVFPDCTLWTGSGRDWILVGSRGDGERVSLDHFQKQWRDPLVAPELRALGLEQPGQVGALFLADADQIDRFTEGTAPLTDDFPKRLSDRVASGRYRSWMLPERTLPRFTDSRILRETWPEGFVEAGLPWFDAQDDINRILGYDENMTLREANSAELPRIHELLEEDALKTLPLWLLGSSVGLQRAAEAADSKGRRSPEIDYHRGAGELVAGNWSEASRLFESASTGDWTPRLLPFRAYARCRAGDYEDGRSLVKDFRRTKGGRRQGAVLHFLRRTCSPG